MLCFFKEWNFSFQKVFLSNVTEGARIHRKLPGTIWTKYLSMPNPQVLQRVLVSKGRSEARIQTRIKRSLKGPNKGHVSKVASRPIDCVCPSGLQRVLNSTSTSLSLSLSPPVPRPSFSLSLSLSRDLKGDSSLHLSISTRNAPNARQVRGRSRALSAFANVQRQAAIFENS